MAIHHSVEFFFTSRDFSFGFLSLFYTENSNEITKFNYLSMRLAIHYKLTNNLID